MSATFSLWIIALYLMRKYFLRELRDIFFARHFLRIKYILYHKADLF